MQWGNLSFFFGTRENCEGHLLTLCIERKRVSEGFLRSGFRFSGFPSGVGSFCCLTWFLVLFLSLILRIPPLWLIARVLCCRECRLCCTGGLLFILEFLAMHHPRGVKCFWEETIDWGAETEAGSATLWQPVYTLKRSSAKKWDYLESES